MSTEGAWTVRKLLEWTTAHLERKGIEDARKDAQLLLAHALGCSRTQIYMNYETEPADEARARFRELVQQRLAGKPVAHLLGRKEFFSLEFEVSPAVLIPRPDSEWLVTRGLELAKPLDEPRILDVGTGSGCLAVALAKQNKKARLTAIDISPEALVIAARNATRHQVAERIRFLEGDLYSPLSAGERFHLIVSNPPYILTGELATLAPEVRDQEPHLALDGGPEGFTVFDRLVAGAPEFLEPGGSLLIEIHAGLEEESRRRFEQVSGFTLEKTIHDHAGLPRVLVGRWQPA